MKKLFAGVLGIFMGFIGPAHADEDTYNYLLSQYASESFDYEVVVRSDLSLAECSAIWEIYLTLRSLGAGWVDMLFPDAGGDPTQILSEDAFRFCAEQFGLHRDTKEEVCPCSRYCQTYDDSSLNMAAARGCAMLFLAANGEHNDTSGYSSYLNDFMSVMQEALSEGNDLSTDDAAMYFCRGDTNHSDISEFWIALDYELESCQMMIGSCGYHSVGCERVATLMHTIARFWIWQGMNYSDLYSQRYYLYDVICNLNHSDFLLFGADLSECQNNIDTILDNFLGCWNRYWNGTKSLEDLWNNRYVLDWDDQGRQVPASNALIYDVLDTCATEFPDAAAICPAYCMPTRCTENYWGTYQCSECGVNNNQAPKSFVDECASGLGFTGTKSDRTGTFQYSETCEYGLVGLGA